MPNVKADGDWTTHIGTLNSHVLKTGRMGEKIIARSAKRPEFPGRNSAAMQHAIQNLLFDHDIRVAKSIRVIDEVHDMAFVVGQGDPESNLASLSGVDAVSALTYLGKELAKMHAIPRHALPNDLGTWQDKANAMLEFAEGLGRVAQNDCKRFRRLIDLASVNTSPQTFVHNDFRTGNYLIHEGAVTGILDFDLSCWGHPWMDLAWFSTPKWRYQNQGLVAGGLASVEVLLQAYNRHARVTVDLSEYAFWMAFSHSRLAVMRHVQTARGY